MINETQSSTPRPSIEDELKRVLLRVRRERIKSPQGSQDRRRLASVIICLEDALNMCRGRE
jgi:hypothetical protein